VSLFPSARDYAGLRTSWRTDMLAGVTVGIVALPLALAFGVTSGLGAAAGLITAIVAGIVAGVFGGSNLQVSGPTGAMTVVLVPVVAHFGANGVLVVGLLAGLALVGASIAKLGRYVAFIPWPVVEGFTVGIAVIIFLQQVPAALGVPKPVGTNTVAVAVQALAYRGGHNWTSLLVTVLVAVIMIALPRLHRSLPASLLAVVSAAIVAEAAHLSVSRIGVIPSSLPIPHVPSLHLSDLGTLLPSVFAITALAAIESLLSAKVGDGMADGPEHDPDRELFGQGLANIAVALFGGMPATGAIARTAVNARAGARTRVAAITHGVVLLFVVLLLARAVKVIPLAALSGVLIVTAVRMVEFGSVVRLLRSTRRDALVMVATAFATIAFDLVVAVEIGIVLASLLALRAVANAASFEQEPIDHIDIDAAAEHELLHEHIVTYRLDGALFFGATERFLMELAGVADVQVVILRLGRLQVLDATGAQALGDIVTHLHHRGITVLLCSVRPHHLRLMDGVGTLDALAHEHHLLPTIDEALAHAREHVAGRLPGSVLGSYQA